MEFPPQKKQAQAGHTFQRTALLHPKRLQVELLWSGAVLPTPHHRLHTFPRAGRVTQARPDTPRALGKFSYVGVGIEGPAEAQTATSHLPPRGRSACEEHRTWLKGGCTWWTPLSQHPFFLHGVSITSYQDPWLTGLFVHQSPVSLVTTGQFPKPEQPCNPAVSSLNAASGSPHGQLSHLPLWPSLLF